MMNETLRGVLDDYACCYLDNILIYSENKEEHREHVREVLRRLKGKGLLVKGEKCEWYQKEVGFLGYIVSGEGIAMDLKKLESIVGWPAPANRHDVQVFLRFVNFYRNQVRYFSKEAKVLHQLTKKDVTWEWSPARVAAFETLKQMLVEAPI